MSLKSFKEWLLEAQIFSGKPYHSYRTVDGHKVDVHMVEDGAFRVAHFVNKSIGGHIVKIGVQPREDDVWTHDELEHLGKEKLDESFAQMTNKDIGDISEHSMAAHLTDLKHLHQGTFGSPEHKAEKKVHTDAISAIAKGKDPREVGIRAEHGRVMAKAAHEDLKEKYGESVKIHRVGITNKDGDIPKFTKGAHNDTDENPSDVSVEISHSHTHDEDEGIKAHHGFSAKSTGKNTGDITAKNPGLNALDTMLDHPKRKSNINKVASDGKKAVNEKHGIPSNLPDRSKTGESKKSYVKSRPGLDKKMNVDFAKVNNDSAKELHDQMHHLTKQGPAGHHQIGKALSSMLTSNTSMPFTKITGHGSEEGKIHAVTGGGSESPLHHLLNDKNTRYEVSHNGSAVHVHQVKSDGTKIKLATISTKFKSHGSYSSPVGNVKPGELH